jgi:hypothetical protein
MTSRSLPTIDVNQLSQGLPAITPALGSTLVEAIAICLSEQNHPTGSMFLIEGNFETAVELQYPAITAQMRRCWNDDEYATEQAAYGIAILLLQHLTGLTVIERSRRGTGFDYWLGTAQANLPFQRMMRLEVSGIRAGSRRLINARVKLKQAQVKRFAHPLPATIVVVEFSTPCSHISAL